jgi:hypothetical protein
MAMTNLTLTMDERLLKRARVRALEQETSVDAVVCSYLKEDAERGPRQKGLAGFLALTESIDAGSGSADRSWQRDELHER